MSRSHCSQQPLRPIALRVGIATLVCICCCNHAVAENVIPDPLFAAVREFVNVKTSDAKGWCWQPIIEPCRVQVDSKRRAITLQGGKVFLHSSEFPVHQSTVYELQIEAAGDARFSVEVLWWQKNGLPARPHRAVFVKPKSGTLNARRSRFTARGRSPRNAATAYLRLIVESGRAVIRAPVFRVVSGKLLLSLDAAAPGPKPNLKWRDLTGRNQDFQLRNGVRYSSANKSYVFERPGAQCVGAQRDASRFDFETDVAAGNGKGSPFTVVLYAKLTGRSGSGLVNKFAKNGWSLGLVFDEFGLDRIMTIQQSGKHRTINGFPGYPGQNNRKLNVTDGKFHLYVVHMTGSGTHDGTVYLDGGTKSLPLTAWPFGSLASGSIRNNAPLRIGATERGKESSFRGELGFLEIWSGSRLRQAMTPAEYSRFRYRNGSPARGPKSSSM